MGDQQHRNPAAVQISEQTADSCARRLIQTGRRLVQQQHIRMTGDNPRNGCKPLLSTGQAERRAVADIANMQQFQRFIDTLRDFLLGKPQIARAVRDILGHRLCKQLSFRMLHDQSKPVSQLDSLGAGQRAHPRPGLDQPSHQPGLQSFSRLRRSPFVCVPSAPVICGYRDAVDGDIAAVGALQGGQQPDQRGFPCSVGAHERHGFAGTHGESQPMHAGEGCALRGEGHMVHTDRGCRAVCGRDFLGIG